MKNLKLKIFIIIVILMIVFNFNYVKATNEINDPDFDLGEQEVIFMDITMATIQVNQEIQLIASSSKDATIRWSSDNEEVAMVSDTGMVTGISEGYAVITAKGEEAEAICEINIISTREEENNLSDFSNAFFEIKNTGTTARICIMQTLEISNISFSDSQDNKLYYAITRDQTEPSEEEFIQINKYDDTSIRIGSFEKYTELNGNIYLWIKEEYINAEGQTEQAYRVADQELDRAKIAKYTELFSSTFIEKDKTQIEFNMPSYSENRKCNIKIGKITDNNLLKTIKEDYEKGFEELINYAQSSSSIFDKKLNVQNDEITENLGLPTLDAGSYYYMYAQFDDESGKYYPIEGITIAQAGSTGKTLNFYGTDNFKWNISGNSGNGNNGNSNGNGGNTGGSGNQGTQSPDPIPQAGMNIIIVIAIAGVLGIGIISYIQYRKYKEIK